MGHQRDGHLSIDVPATCLIRFAGRIDASWRERLGDWDFAVTGASSGIETTLAGRLADQVALAGLLSTLYDHGLPILSVQCLDWES